MQSNNPVFRRSEEFNGTANSYGNMTYAGNGQPYAGYGQPQAPWQAQAPGQQPAYGQAYSDPSTWSTGSPQAPVTTERMTIDSVVQATGLSLLVVIATSILTWWWIGDAVTQANVGQLGAALVVGGGGAFVLSLVNSFKRVISPALVLLFAALEGVALGSFSKAIEWQLGAGGSGVVTSAVLGTFAAFGGTLAAYKFFNIRVGAKFRAFTIAGMFGMVGLGLMSLVLGLFGIDTGLFGVSGIGMITAVIGLVLGIFMLILDFDFVENGIAAGLEKRESWRAAFGLTVSLVWIYTNLLRILAFFNQD